MWKYAPCTAVVQIGKTPAEAGGPQAPSIEDEAAPPDICSKDEFLSGFSDRKGCKSLQCYNRPGSERNRAALAPKAPVFSFASVRHLASDSSPRARPLASVPSIVSEVSGTGLRLRPTPVLRLDRKTARPEPVSLLYRSAEAV